MRTFESIVVGLLILTWIGMVFPRLRAHRWMNLLPVITAITALLQLVVEKFRWQMTLVYALILLSLLLAIPGLLREQGKQSKKLAIRVLKVVGIVLGSIVLILAIAVLVLFPQFELPQPTGEFAVGTTSFEWVDLSRPETITSDESDYRDLLVQVWYPAEMIANANPLPMWPSAFGPSLAKQFALPAFAFHHMSMIRSHSYAELPLNSAQSTYPVVIFSHGYIPGFSGQNTVQMEELASHGYVVFSVAHTYESAAELYPNGRTAPVDQARFSTIGSELGSGMDEMKQYIDAVNPVDKENAFRQYLKAIPTLQESVSIWTQDMIFVMDQVERLNGGEIPSRFSGHLSVERMGVFGMSMGGAVAAEVCLLDQRCKAGANLDGLQFGSLIDGEIDQPFFMMNSAPNASMNDVILDRFQGKLHRIIVKNSSHFNYADFQLISPLFQLIHATGSISPYRMETILNSYLLGFFDTYLKDMNVPLLNGPNQNFSAVEYSVSEGNK